MDELAEVVIMGYPAKWFRVSDVCVVNVKER